MFMTVLPIEELVPCTKPELQITTVVSDGNPLPDLLQVAIFVHTVEEYEA